MTVNWDNKITVLPEDTASWETLSVNQGNDISYQSVPPPPPEELRTLPPPPPGRAPQRPIPQVTRDMIRRNMSQPKAIMPRNDSHENLGTMQGPTMSAVERLISRIGLALGFHLPKHPGRRLDGGNFLIPDMDKLNRKKNWVLVGKIALVVLVLVGLTLATVFTGGAAAGALVAGAVAWKVGMLFGITAGLGLSALSTVPVAIKCKMFQFTNANRKDALKFLGVQALVSSALVAVGAGIGAGINTVGLALFRKV